jgi:outer membrane receptor protein involved in Fe transport
MPEVQNKYGFDTIPLYPLSGRNPVKDKPITENGPIVLPGLGPEKVRSTEIGYKGLLFNKKLFMDAYGYYNMYKGFEAVQLVAQLAADAGTEKDQYYQTYFTTSTPVSSVGWALGLDYKLPDGMMLKGNVTWDKLLDDITDPGVETRFNTPEYRTNFSVGHNEIMHNLGFNVNLHWQSAFIWESGFGAGRIPANATVDAHISYKVTAMKTVIKLGGSNITNHYYTTSFGSAQIGGLYYISLVYEDIMGYAGRNRN